MNDIETFVRLKYQILTSDESTWHLCGTYPFRVQVKWFLRCIEAFGIDIEDVASKNCVEIIKKWLDGKVIEQEELYRAGLLVLQLPRSLRSYMYMNILYDITRAIKLNQINCNENYFIHGHEINNLTKTSSKWKLYISWLIEELYEYECCN